MFGASTANHKASAPLTLFVPWKMWSDRNARVLRSKNALPLVLLDKSNTEAKLWVTAGAKRLSEILQGD
jgi:hypothetical protein